MVVQHDAPARPVPDADLLRRWRAIPVPVVVDLAPATQIDPALRPLRPAGAQPALFGLAFTVRCAPPDFGAVLRALDRVKRSEVLVIDAGGDCRAAVIGDVLGGHLHRIGAAGIVCDGAVRDTAGLAGMAGLSVYARGVNPKGPTSADGGEIGGPVTIGGRTVAPGDVILGDDDGLAALTPDLLGPWIDAAEAKLALEARWTALLSDGQPVSAIFGLP